MEISDIVAVGRVTGSILRPLNKLDAFADFRSGHLGAAQKRGQARTCNGPPATITLRCAKAKGKSNGEPTFHYSVPSKRKIVTRCRVACPLPDFASRKRP